MDQTMRQFRSEKGAVFLRNSEVSAVPTPCSTHGVFGDLGPGTPEKV